MSTPPPSPPPRGLVILDLNAGRAAKKVLQVVGRIVRDWPFGRLFVSVPPPQRVGVRVRIKRRVGLVPADVQD